MSGGLTSGASTAEGKEGTPTQGFMPIAGDHKGNIQAFHASSSGELYIRTLEAFGIMIKQNELIIHHLSLLSESTLTIDEV